MTDQKMMTPAIDVAPLFDSNPDVWVPVDRLIGEACQRKGGFVVTGLPPLQQNFSFERFFRIFELPDPVLYDIAKREMRPDSRLTMRGYLNRDKGGFAYGEQFDLGPEGQLRGPEIDGIDMLLNENAWPSSEPYPGWQEEIIKHFKQMESIGCVIIGSIARYLEVNDHAAIKRYQNSSSILRFLKYPERPEHIEIGGETGAMRVVDGSEVPLVASEHTDNGGLTFQWQDEPGLQIKTPEEKWLGIPNIRDGFSVHLGETLETQSLGRVSATPHRVYSTGKTRQSMVFFLEPNFFGSTEQFSKGQSEQRPSNENTYAASMVKALRKTGRA